MVRIGPGVGMVTGIATVLQGWVEIGSRCFVVMTFLAGGGFFGRRHMRVVTLLAFIFLESRVYIGLFDYVLVAGITLSDGTRLEQARGVGGVGVVAQLTIPGKP